jgi:hypothetical protein
MIDALLFFAMGWFVGIASVVGAIIWAYRKGVGG